MKLKFYIIISILMLSVSFFVLFEVRDYINPLNTIAPTFGLDKLEGNVKRINDFEELRESYLKTIDSFRRERISNIRTKLKLVYFTLFTAIVSITCIVVTIRKNKKLYTPPNKKH